MLARCGCAALPRGPRAEPLEVYLHAWVREMLRKDLPSMAPVADAPEARPPSPPSPVMARTPSPEAPDDTAALSGRAEPPNLTPFEKRLWAAFIFADKDDSGFISKREFHAILKQVRTSRRAAHSPPRPRSHPLICAWPGC